MVGLASTRQVCVCVYVCFGSPRCFSFGRIVLSTAKPADAAEASTVQQTTLQEMLLKLNSVQRITVAYLLGRVHGEIDVGERPRLRVGSSLT